MRGDILLIYNIFKLNKNKINYILINILLIILFSFVYWFYGTSDNLSFAPQFGNSENNISYISALFFSCTTHSTVGYGDITAKSRFMQGIVTAHLVILILNLSILLL